MKTAISIPDSLFQSAEAYAHAQGLSRSELYARALQLYLQIHQESNVTAVLDQLHAEEPGTLDPDMKRAEARTLLREDW